MPWRARQAFHAPISAIRPANAPIAVQRERSDSSGRTSPIATSGPMFQITNDTAASSTATSTQRLKTRPSNFLIMACLAPASGRPQPPELLEWLVLPELLEPLVQLKPHPGRPSS